MLLYLLVMMLYLFQVFRYRLILFGDEIKHSVGLKYVQTNMSHISIEMDQSLKLRVSLVIDLLINDFNFDWVYLFHHLLRHNMMHGLSHDSRHSRLNSDLFSQLSLDLLAYLLMNLINQASFFSLILVFSSYVL
jgi:hypothetical protein